MVVRKWPSSIGEEGNPETRAERGGFPFFPLTTIPSSGDAVSSRMPQGKHRSGHKTRSVTCWSWVTELLELQLPGYNVTVTLPLQTCCRSRRRRACSLYLFPPLLNPLERMHWFLLPGVLISQTGHTCAGRAGGVAGRREAVGAFPAGEIVVTGKKEVELRGCFHVEDWAGCSRPTKPCPKLITVLTLAR